MKHSLMFSLFTAALLAAGAASAGGGNLFGGEGGAAMESGTMYGGASMGQATTNCMIHDALGGNAAFAAVKGAEEDCTANGWKVYGGYKVTDMIGIEGGYYNLGEADEKLVEPSTNNTLQANGTATGLGVSGVLSVPLADGFEVFGKAGAMKWQSEGTMTLTEGSTVTTGKTDVDGVSLLLGAGAHYKFNENWGVRGEYERFTRQDIMDKDRDVSIMSAGVTFSTL